MWTKLFIDQFEHVFLIIPFPKHGKKTFKKQCYALCTDHLLELATITPLSMEKASLGRPKMFHAWILIGSPMVLLREKSLEQGIFAAWD